MTNRLDERETHSDQCQGKNAAYSFPIHSSTMRQQTIRWILIPASLATIGLLIAFVALVRCESQLQFLSGRSDNPCLR